MILGYPHFRKPPSLVFHLVDVLPACRFHATQGYVKSQNFPKPTTLSYHLPRNGTFRTWTCGIIAAESDRLVFFNWTISGSMCFCIAFCDTEKRLKTSQKHAILLLGHEVIDVRAHRAAKQKNISTLVHVGSTTYPITSNFGGNGWKFG